MLINVWSHDIGRQNAANLPLLRMVFEVNLQVFQEADAPKTVLLFVIRDHVSSTTSLEVLAERIMKDMNALWANVAKPQHWAHAAITDVFEFSFNSLAHFVLEPENFERDCNALQERFYNHKSKKYLFRRAHPKAVVSAGFADYAKGIWDTILENRNLDLPAQKQVLSLHRCTDTLNQAYGMFLEDWRSMLTTASAGRVLPHFESEVSNLLKRTFGLYDAVTLGYHPEVRERKAEELRGKVVQDLKQLVEAQLASQTVAMKEKFKGRFDKAMAATQAGADPAAAMNEAKEAAFAVGPDPRALASPDLDPVVVQVMRGPYNDLRSRFLAEIEADCLRAMLDHANQRQREAAQEVAGLRDTYEKKLQRAQEEARSSQQALEAERSSQKQRAEQARSEVALAQERANQAEEELKSLKRRVERAEQDREEYARKFEAELALRTRELQDALEAGKQHKQAANQAQAEATRLADEHATAKKMLEAENRTLREEFSTAGRKASEAQAQYLNMKEESRRDRERCAELEGRITTVTETVTSQAKALVALADERTAVTDSLSKKNAFLTQKQEEMQETLAYYEKIIAGNREELMDLRDKLATSADYGETTGTNLRKCAAELEDMKHRNTDLFNENQYLIQLLNQKQNEFYEEYRRSLHERQMMAARLDDMERVRSAQGMYMGGGGPGGPMPTRGIQEATMPVSGLEGRRKMTIETSSLLSQRGTTSIGIYTTGSGSAIDLI